MRVRSKVTPGDVDDRRDGCPVYAPRIANIDSAYSLAHLAIDCSSRGADRSVIDTQCTRCSSKRLGPFRRIEQTVREVLAWAKTTPAFVTEVKMGISAPVDIALVE